MIRRRERLTLAAFVRRRVTGARPALPQPVRGGRLAVGLGAVAIAGLAARYTAAVSRACCYSLGAAVGGA